MDLQRTIFRSFKSKGLALSADASTALSSVLSREEDVSSSLNLIISSIQERVQKSDSRSTIIDLNTIQSVVADLSSTDEDLDQEKIQLLDAYDLPKLCFDERQKSFKVLPTPKYCMLGDAESRANMYRERLLLTQQRLLRSDMFQMRGMGGGGSRGGLSVGGGEKAAVHELSTIESLLGSTGQKVLFGMLTQPEEGAWFLEDLGATIRLDLSKAQAYPVFFTEGCHVIVQGFLENGLFRVGFMGMAPAEEREKSLGAMGVEGDLWGGIRPQQMAQMREMEEAADGQMMVVLSDVQLDKPLVLEKLALVLEGFENNGSEPLYVLMGSFISKPISRSPGGREVVEGAFDALADVIARYPRQASMAKFLLVPGPLDAGMGVALPRRGIPEQFTKRLRAKVASVTFASNPCRVRYYTQEIVLFREDLLKKMQRHLAVPLDLSPTSPDITEQLVETLLDQAHLCPLPLHARPVFWELDYSLRLFPLPHVLVLADHADTFNHSYKGCRAVNPGSFSSDFSFLVYHPHSREVEYSRVP